MKIIGVVHLKGLPGSPSNILSLDEIINLAQKDVNSLVNGGVDGIIIENFGDVPFVKDNVSKRTVASFTSVVNNLAIGKDIYVGINVLRNDAIAALSIAESTKSDFVRINILNNMMYTDQGIIEGNAHEVNFLKKTLSHNIKIYADVFVKHAVPPPGSTIQNHTKELLERAGADVVIITGDGTGQEINFDDLMKVRKIVPKGKLAVGSGVTVSNIQNYIGIADILIIGTHFKVERNVLNPVNTESVKRLISKLK